MIGVANMYMRLWRNKTVHKRRIEEIVFFLVKRVEYLFGLTTQKYLFKDASARKKTDN